jgi:hypothetical protein
VTLTNETNPLKNQALPFPHPHDACTDELDGFPSVNAYNGSKYYPLGHDNTNISIFDNGSGTCSVAQAQEIAKVFRQAISDLKGCLAQTNLQKASQLDNALASYSLAINCGGNCTDNGSSVLATTDLPWSPLHFNGYFPGLLGNQRMGLNMDYLSAQGDGALEDVMAHELLHWAGVAHDSDATELSGKDGVYGCGRYCTGCPGKSVTTGAGDFSADCARCADGAHKAQCGTKTDTQDGQCSDAPICTTQFGTSPCQLCRNGINKYCDDTTAPGGQGFLCCEQCPSGLDAQNLDCTGNPPPPTSNCNAPNCSSNPNVFH